jgi:hypothetical protein
MNLRSFTWKKVKTHGKKKPKARQQHSSCTYDENKMVIFGGVGAWDLVTKKRRLYNDTWVYDDFLKTW